MKIRLIGFALLTALNGYVTHQLWDALCISKLPVCFLALSYLCGVLFLINIKEKTQRVLTYNIYGDNFHPRDYLCPLLPQAVGVLHRIFVRSFVRQELYRRSRSQG